jgi:hypothetical protein
MPTLSDMPEIIQTSERFSVDQLRDQFKSKLSLCGQGSLLLFVVVGNEPLNETLRISVSLTEDDIEQGSEIVERHLAKVHKRDSPRCCLCKKPSTMYAMNGGMPFVHAFLALVYPGCEDHIGTCQDAMAVLQKLKRVPNLDHIRPGRRARPVLAAMAKLGCRILASTKRRE